MRRINETRVKKTKALLEEKKQKKQQEIAQQQSTEDYSQDLVGFVEHVKRIDDLNFKLDDWQRDFLKAAEDPGIKQIALLCTRQAGKSEMVSLVTCWTMLTKPKSLCLLLSPILRQSGELFKKVMDNFDLLNERYAQRTALTCKLKNGSRCVSIPANQNIRGFSKVALIAEDEDAQVPDNIYYTAALPMLAVSQGKLILLSSPYGQRGHFWDICVNGRDTEWQKFEVPANLVPRITPEWLAQRRAEMLESFYQQEYFCKFNENLMGAFTTQSIEDSFEENVEQWEV
jgi:hypothetical protein